MLQQLPRAPTWSEVPSCLDVPVVIVLFYAQADCFCELFKKKMQSKMSKVSCCLQKLLILFMLT